MSTDSARSAFDWPAGWTPGPLHEPPRSVYPPYTRRRFVAVESRLERAVALVHALVGIEIEAHDARTRGGWPAATLRPSRRWWR
jgi:hypothetical protein